MHKPDAPGPNADETVPTGGPTTLVRGVSWRPDVLAMVDSYAAAVERPRSWVVNRLLETHPDILRMRGVA